MRPRGCLLGLLGALVGLALVGTLVDVGARHYATSRVENRIRLASPESRGVKARIRSWPFLQAAVNGKVDEIDARVVRLVEKPLVFSDVAVTLRGVRIDQGKLGSEGRLVIKHIDTGRVTLSITAADLAGAVGIPITLADAVAGAPAGRVRISIDGPKRQLMVEVVGVHKFGFALPGQSLLPCIPTAAVTPARIILGCPLTRVPEAFLATAA